MVEIGRVNKLKVIREREIGFIFDGGDLGSILKGFLI